MIKIYKNIDITYHFDDIRKIDQFSKYTDKQISDILNKELEFSIERNKLEEFYNKTNLNISHILRNDTKSVLFTKLGSIPLADEGSGAYMFPTGEYEKVDDYIDLNTHIIIEETVDDIKQNKDEYLIDYIDKSGVKPTVKLPLVLF